MKKKQESFNTLYVYLFMSILFSVGFVYGTLIRKKYKGIIDTSYVEAYFNSVDYTKPSILELLGHLMEEFSYFFILWFLALTVVGSLIVVFIVFFVGFIYGFTFSYFIDIYGYKGIIIGSLYTFPKNIFLIPLLIYLASQSVLFSMQLMLSIYNNYNRKHIKILVNKYMNLLFFMIVVLIVYILTETVFLNYRVEKLILLL